METGEHLEATGRTLAAWKVLLNPVLASEQQQATRKSSAYSSEGGGGRGRLGGVKVCNRSHRCGGADPAGRPRLGGGRSEHPAGRRSLFGEDLARAARPGKRVEVAFLLSPPRPGGAERCAAGRACGRG